MGRMDIAVIAVSFGIPVMALVTVRWYLPFFRRLNLTSAYEYLEVRFNLPCRLFASAAFILFMVARTAIVAYLPSLALCAVDEPELRRTSVRLPRAHDPRRRQLRLGLLEGGVKP